MAGWRGDGLPVGEGGGLDGSWGGTWGGGRERLDEGAQARVVEEGRGGREVRAVEQDPVLPRAAVTPTAVARAAAPAIAP